MGQIKAIDSMPAEYAQRVILDQINQGRTYDDLAQTSGLSKSTIKSWATSRKKYVDLYMFDTFACSLGIHIGTIYPDYWLSN